ncbi:hypothetical protein O164_13540 [Pseudomonas taiwanensis SJ9]|uniref:Uncharacterized protein n=1 Tax=Pseudomonas taiwanensis SJ9 TaxID=1388762 RepID=V7DAB5_9PSED|nr:hypothetical protein O164_13540 [Pseudomonas taiwanensis SJ9]
MEALASVLNLLFARVSFKKWMLTLMAICLLGQIIKYLVGAPEGRLW